MLLTYCFIRPLWARFFDELQVQMPWSNVKLVFRELPKGSFSFMAKLIKNSVQEQLARILGSEEFSTARRLSDFLEYIVSETLADRSASLQAYPIALEVFERTPDFDPQIDTIVRVQAGQLRLRLQEYYAQSGRCDPVLIKVPKGGYVPTFTERDLPTNTRTSEAVGDDPTPSIIVLPFSNLSGDASFEYFNLGLTEEIIAALSCFPDIKLYARNLAYQVDNSGIDFVQFANDNNVRFLLDGNVRRGRNMLRISVRLIDTKTSKILWNSTYDREYIAADIFEVENEIAAKVVAEIAGPNGDIVRHDLLEASRQSPESQSAYEAVLRAYGYWHNPDRNKHREVSELLEAAVRKDPNYSDASVMLSRMYLDQRRFGYNLVSTIEDAIEKAIHYAKHAIKYAPNNAISWHLLSLAHFEKREYELFEQTGTRALSLCPNHPDILAQFGLQLWNLGQLKRGVRMAQKALSLTPFPAGSYYFTYVHDDFINGRDEQALLNTLKLETNDLFWMHFLQVAILGQLGRTDDAQNALKKVLELNPDFKHLTIDLIESWSFPPAFKARLIDGLKKAGYIFPTNVAGMAQFVFEK